MPIMLLSMKSLQNLAELSAQFTQEKKKKVNGEYKLRMKSIFNCM